MTQREAQESSYRIATQWYVEHDVTCGDVSLGDVMEYDVLRVVGALFLNEIRGDGRDQERSEIG